MDFPAAVAVAAAEVAEVVVRAAEAAEVQRPTAVVAAVVPTGN